jgi:hypothetical protein
MGFVAAGTVASLYQLVTSEPADFFATRPSLGAWAVAVMLIMFGGPAIIARRIWTGLQSHELSIPAAAVGVVFTWMWSVFAGLFLVSLLLRV